MCACTRVCQYNTIICTCTVTVHTCTRTSATQNFKFHVYVATRIELHVVCLLGDSHGMQAEGEALW